MTPTPVWKPALLGQYGGALDMLENAMRACPDAVWADPADPVERQFWYLAFHTLFWHDHYVGTSDRGYAPPAPFTLDEMDPAGIYPASPYSRDQLLAFLEHGRRRIRERITQLTEAEAAERSGFARREISNLELLLYNLRHVQHHTAQLNLLLRQRTDSAPKWVGRGRDAPAGIPAKIGQIPAE